MITEDQLEQLAIQWFQDTWWTYVHGAVIAPEGMAAEREDFRAVVLKGRLAEAVRHLNSKLPESAVEEVVHVVHVVTNPEHPSLVQNNRAFHRYLMERVLAEFTNAKGKEKRVVGGICMRSQQLFKAIKVSCASAAVGFCLAACGTYSPLDDKDLRQPLVPAPTDEGVKVTFLGNTTILVSDGETKLLVDGFFSRPGPLETLFGKVGPNHRVIEEELDRIRLGKYGSLDAILVGHSHYDHALDTVEVAKRTGALVMGNDSYRYIHEGNGGKMDSEHLWVAPRDGKCNHSKKVGEFVITFVPSDHVSSHSCMQDMVEGHIEEPLKIPAHFSKFKCGDVFAIHIAHREGNLFVTTTAGYGEGKTQGLQADIVFLGVGLLGKEDADQQKMYWEENVTALRPKVVVPVHWDSFTRKLSRGLKPPLLIVDDTKKSIDVVKRSVGDKRIHIMDLDESVYLKRKEVLQGRRIPQIGEAIRGRSIEDLR